MKMSDIPGVGWFANREWAMFVGLMGTVVAYATDGFGQISDTAAEVQGLSLIEALPIILAAATRLYVWSEKSVEEIAKEAQR